MNLDSEGCSECSEEEEEIEISRSRLSHISVSINLGKLLTLQNPITPSIPAGKMRDPHGYEETCVNPACGEWQEDIGRILDNINERLEDVARTGDWTSIDEEKVKHLAQLSESALDRVDERGIEWPDIEKQIEWEKIEDLIDDFGENFEPAAEYTMFLHNLRGTPNPGVTESLHNSRGTPNSGIGKLSETASSLENLTELRNSIETEVAIDAETITNESGEEEEQGPIEGLEALNEEKETRIEERQAEKEAKIAELKADVEALKEEQQEMIEELKDEKNDRIGERKEGIDELKAEIGELKEEQQDRVGWREEEVEELGEENKKQIEELQEEIRNIKKQKENQIGTRREQIDEQRGENKEIREEYEEKVTETRAEYDEKIETTRAENKERITEIRDEYDEQITEIREEYENRIDNRRDQLTGLQGQSADTSIEESTERDRDRGKGTASGVTAGSGDDPPSPGASTQEGEEAATGTENGSNTPNARANGGADAGESVTGSPGEGDDPTDAGQESEQGGAIDTNDTESVSKGQRWLENPDAEKPDPTPEQYEQLAGEPLPETVRNGHNGASGIDREDDHKGRDDTGTGERDDDSAAGGPSR